MKTYGIVAEFNPFHNGHRYLISQAREKGAEGIICVMSGNFVQRGEPAVCSKWRRAEMALKSGADLIIELPAVWSVASAEKFSFGAVSLLENTGAADNIIFGSENAEPSELSEIAEVLLSPEYSEKIKKLSSTGLSYPAAREKALSEILGEEKSAVIKTPNNILGVEYCKALMRLGSCVKPETVTRKGVSHDSEKSENEFASASSIRKMIGEDINLLSPFMPQEAFEIIKKAESEGRLLENFNGLNRPLLSSLRKASPEDLRKVPDVSEGLEYRILESVKGAKSFYETADLAKTKRYTHSRLRRIILSYYLELFSGFCAEPPYIRVLGFNKNGQKLLSQMREKAKIPVIMKYGDVKTLSEAGKKVFEAETKAVDLYNLLFEEIRPCGENMTHNPVIIKE